MHQDRATYRDAGVFTPGDGAIDVRFVKGNEGFSAIPQVVALSGLNERFAVIQETGIDGCNDWYFDKLLWRALVKYVVGQGGQVTALVDWRDEDEVPIEKFIDDWEKIDPQVQEPPWVLFTRVDGHLTLSMVTEYWCLSGGPWPYSDSYTYSFFSDRDVSEEVNLAIKGDPAVSRWRIAEAAILISPTNSKPSPVVRHRFRSFMAWLRRWG